MPEALQPVAGSLSAVVRRACQQPDCPHFQTATCPDHARVEDLGIVAAFDSHTAEQSAHG